MNVCVSICVCMNVSMHICLCVGMYASMYVCASVEMSVICVSKGSFLTLCFRCCDFSSHVCDCLLLQAAEDGAGETGSGVGSTSGSRRPEPSGRPFQVGSQSLKRLPQV